MAHSSGMQGAPHRSMTGVSMPTGPPLNFVHPPATMLGYCANINPRVQNYPCTSDAPQRAAGWPMYPGLQQVILDVNANVNETTSALREAIQKAENDSAEAREIAEGVRELEKRGADEVRELLERVKVLEDHSDEWMHTLGKLAATQKIISDQQSLISEAMVKFTRRLQELEDANHGTPNKLQVPANFLVSLLATVGSPSAMPISPNLHYEDHTEDHPATREIEVPSNDDTNSHSSPHAPHTAQDMCSDAGPTVSTTSTSSRPPSHAHEGRARQEEESPRASTSSTCSEGVTQAADAPGDIRTRRSPPESLGSHSTAVASAGHTYTLFSGCGRGVSCISAAETLVNAPSPKSFVSIGPEKVEGSRLPGKRPSTSMLRPVFSGSSTVIGDRFSTIASSSRSRQDEDSSSLSSRSTSPGGTVSDLRARLREIWGSEQRDTTRPTTPREFSREPLPEESAASSKPGNEENETGRQERARLSSLTPPPSTETEPSTRNSTPSDGIDGIEEPYEPERRSRSASRTLSRTTPTPPVDDNELPRGEDRQSSLSSSTDTTPEPDFVEPKVEELDPTGRLATPTDLQDDQIGRNLGTFTEAGGGSDVAGGLEVHDEDIQAPPSPVVQSSAYPLPGSPSDGHDLGDVPHVRDANASVDTSYELFRQSGMDLERSPSVLSDISDSDAFTNGGHGSSSEEVSRMLGAEPSSSSERDGLASAATLHILRKRRAAADAGARNQHARKRRKNEHKGASNMASPSSTASSSTLVSSTKKRGPGRPRKRTRTSSVVSKRDQHATHESSMGDSFQFCKWKVVDGFEGPYFWPDKLQSDESLNSIQCDKCTAWYHCACAGVKPDDGCLVGDLDFICPACTYSYARCEKYLTLEGISEDSAVCGRPDCSITSYRPERLVGRRPWHGDPSKLAYLVKWADYSIYDSSWEPLEQLQDDLQPESLQQLIKEFERAAKREKLPLHDPQAVLGLAENRVVTHLFRADL